MEIEKKLFHLVGSAIEEYQLIQSNDRILIGLSGGKDSLTLTYVLEHLRRKAPIDFEIVALHINQGYKNYSPEQMLPFLQNLGIEYHFETFDIAKIIEEKNTPGKSPCALCAKLRRGALYGFCEKYNCNKLALGHHRDDFIETLLLNQFFIGKTASMSARLLADNKMHTLIRPLVYVPEELIHNFSLDNNFPIQHPDCPLSLSCHTSQRNFIKKLLKELEQNIPNIKNSIMGSLKNIQPSHLLDSRWRPQL